MSIPAGLSVMLIGCPEAVVRAVSEGGHRTAISAPETGIAQARWAGLDVVILDLSKAGNDPFGLALGIRAASMWRKPMFLALSDAVTDELGSRCQKAGIDLLLVKPVEPALVTGFLGRLNAVVHDYESFDPMI